MSEKQKAAARANGGRSRGPVSRAGRERIRAANLRHGLYSQAEDVVLACLGEDAQEFACLRQGLLASWPRASAPRVEDLAAAIWKLQRADRRLDELNIQVGLEMVGEAMDSPGAQAPAPFLRALSMQAVAFRKVMRITHSLLEANTRDRKRHLPG